MYWLPVLPFLGLALLCLFRLLPRSRLPPGPRGLPLLGNALEIPLKGLFLKLEEWKRAHGDVYSLNAAGKTIVILGSAKAAADVLDKMSAQTGARPRLVMMSEIMSHSLNLSVIPANEQWKRMRRVVHSGFNNRAVSDYVQLQEEESGRLCRYLLQNPEADVYKTMQKTACSVIFRALYDTASLFVSSSVESKIEKMNEHMDVYLHAAMPMAYLVDAIPLLQHLPTWAIPGQRSGEEFFHEVDGYCKRLYEEGCMSEIEGGKRRGFSAHSEETRQEFHISEQEAAWTSAVAFSAGAETSSVAMQAFCLAMLLYPDVQRRAQAELDTALEGRIPTLADRDRLPYFQALLKETLRWRPPTVNGFPHAATEDISYGEYVIPKGATIIAPFWSICHDPTVFANPSQFQPERFLMSDGNLAPPMPDYHEDDLAYGHGRRICPGKPFANNMLFLEMAHLLWAFDIVKARDQMGQEITPSETKFVDRGLSCRPADFPCVFRPRRGDLADVLPLI